MSIFLCGDAHGYYGRLIKIGKKYRPLIVLGDIGFKYGFLKQYDSSETYLLGGNHDNYKEIIHQPNYLGDYGRRKINGIDFFFIRGAYSVDKLQRILDISWWAEEELNWAKCNDCIIQYYLEKPNIILSHDCPTSILQEMFGYSSILETQTGELLDELLNIHRPKKWIFGHHHRSVNKIIDGTCFICLNELEIFELNL